MPSISRCHKEWEQRATPPQVAPAAISDRFLCSRATAMPYLAPRALGGLRDYQFKPGGYTHLDMLHQPLWNCELIAAGASGRSRRRL